MQIINENNDLAVQKACQLLKDGKIIALPTDTVYGLAVDASNQKAVEDLYHLKMRDKSKPMAIFLKDIEQIKKFFEIEKITQNLIDQYLPGKLTIVARLKNDCAFNFAKNLNFIDKNFLGFRVVDSFFIKKLFLEFNGAIAVSSANLTANKVAISALEIKKYFNKIDLIIDGNILSTTPSTVVKVDNSQITIIRQGAIAIK